MIDLRALNDLGRAAANFRFMMNAFSDEYAAAVASGRGKFLIDAVRAYVNLVEASMSDVERRSDQP